MAFRRLIFKVQPGTAAPLIEGPVPCAVLSRR
jgi:hypothetical protein